MLTNSVLDESLSEHNQLFRRKGGGGHGSSGHSSGRSGGKGGPSVAKAHGASSAFTESRGSKAISLSSTGTTASPYSDGGGKPFTLGSDSIFSGRQAGGGGRVRHLRHLSIYISNQIIYYRKLSMALLALVAGTPMADMVSMSIQGRSLTYSIQFRFHMDIMVAMRSGCTTYTYTYHLTHLPLLQYLHANNTERPGGNLVTAVLQPSFNISSITYRLVGDNASVIAVFDALVVNCSIVNSSSAITPFTPSPSTWPLPEQVVQYYRASSFALSLDVYNNTASLPSNQPTSNNSAPPNIADTALPSGLNITFLACVNMTVGASVPLEDVSSGKKISGGEIAGIVFAAIIAIVGLILFCAYPCCCRSRRKADYEDRLVIYAQTRTTKANFSIP